MVDQKRIKKLTKMKKHLMEASMNSGVDQQLVLKTHSLRSFLVDCLNGGEALPSSMVAAYNEGAPQVNKLVKAMEKAEKECGATKEDIEDIGKMITTEFESEPTNKPQTTVN